MLPTTPTPEPAPNTVNEALAPTSYLIRDMPADDRPRERLRRLGAEALSDSELLAILLRTGIKGVSALQMAQLLLRQFGSLDGLARAPFELVARTKGVGPAKATLLRAAFALARHLQLRPHPRQPSITTPAEAADLLREPMRLLDRETFHVILLNTKNGWLRTCAVSVGSLNASIVEPREVFKEAITHSAAGVILAHNHPSGDPTPSSEDIAITKRLIQAGELLGITVHDHIIMGRHLAGLDRDFVSLREMGLL